MKDDLLMLTHSCQASNSWISSGFMPGKMPVAKAFILKGIYLSLLYFFFLF